jgi:hypothetical protein
VTIYDWMNQRRVERLIDALRLSRTSGVAIENLADDVEKLATAFKPHAENAEGGKPQPLLPVLSSLRDSVRDRLSATSTASGC